MSRYKANKADAVTFNNEPTKTDQSQAANTDINIIVHQFLRTGAAPGGAEPMYADFSELPEDLRGFIEMGRNIPALTDALPEQLRGLSPEQLFALTNEQITAMLKPPEKPADTKENDRENLRDQRQTDRLLHATVRRTGRQERPSERRETGEPGGDDE